MAEQVEWSLGATLELFGPLLTPNPSISDTPEEFLRSIFKASPSADFKDALSLIVVQRSEQLTKNLLEIPLKEGQNLLQQELDVRQKWKCSILALRTFYNLLDADRIKQVTHQIPLSHWLHLLRIRPICLEVSACLSKIAQIIFNHFSLMADYTPLHMAMALTFHDLSNDSDTSFLTTFFLWFLQFDVGYLSECNGMMDPKTFLCVLNIVDTIVDQPSHGKSLLINYNNARFVELYVESIIRNVLDYENREAVVEILVASLSIIANCLIYKPFLKGTYYESSDSTIVRSVCDIFEAICDNDARLQLEEYCSRVETERARGDEEPPRPLPSEPHHRPVRNGPATNLSIVFKSATSSQMSELRTSALKALGALAVKNNEYAQEIANRKLVYQVLTCARITLDSPFQMQHAITTLKMMCTHQQNKESLFEVEQTPTGAIDHEKLLAELGMRAAVDPTSGKLQLEKI